MSHWSEQPNALRNTIVSDSEVLTLLQKLVTEKQVCICCGESTFIQAWIWMFSTTVLCHWWITSPLTPIWMIAMFSFHWTFSSCKVDDLYTQAALSASLWINWKSHSGVSFRASIADILEMGAFLPDTGSTWCGRRYFWVTFLPLPTHSHPDGRFRLWAWCQRYSALRFCNQMMLMKQRGQHRPALADNTTNHFMALWAEALQPWEGQEMGRPIALVKIFGSILSDIRLLGPSFPFHYISNKAQRLRLCLSCLNWLYYIFLSCYWTFVLMNELNLKLNLNQMKPWIIC